MRTLKAHRVPLGAPEGYCSPFMGEAGPTLSPKGGRAGPQAPNMRKVKYIYGVDCSVLWESLNHLPPQALGPVPRACGSPGWLPYACRGVLFKKGGCRAISHERLSRLSRNITRAPKKKRRIRGLGVFLLALALNWVH